MNFKRFQHLRKNQKIRLAQSDVSLCVDDFIQPFFVCEGHNKRESIQNLPETIILSVDQLIKDVSQLVQTGINKMILFPSTTSKDRDEKATQGFSKNSCVVQAIQSLKKEYPQLTIISDICLCAYTSHGHCGIVQDDVIMNDDTLDILAKIALSHAYAGVDYVAPSACMDGQVMRIRQALNKENFTHIKILSYTTKFSSSFYGPFRTASGSDTTLRDRRTYQMDPRNHSQIIPKVEADIEEGADVFMVKPAHTYLDILQRVRTHFPNIKLVAYHVSGECALLHSAKTLNAIQLIPSLEEVFYAFKRSGANWIISYYGHYFCMKHLLKQ